MEVATIRIFAFGLMVAGTMWGQIGNIVVTNAASFQPGLPSNGSVGTIFCTGLSVQGVAIAHDVPLPFSLVGVSLTIGGMAAPLFAVANLGGYQQINFQVPSETFGRNPDGTVPVVVSQNGLQSSANVAPSYSSGEFFRIGETGFGVFQHARDYSTVTSENPAQPGETIVAYATGLPPAIPLVPTGQPAPSSPLSYVPMAYDADPRVGLPSLSYLDLIVDSPNIPQQVEITNSGRSGALPISFVGLTPGAVGLYQINFVWPQFPPGNARVRIEWLECVSHFIYICPSVVANWSRQDSQMVLIPAG
jgi:uncharacterized protein (TIGR03437 family)